jgi:hypothetical protein
MRRHVREKCARSARDAAVAARRPGGEAARDLGSDAGERLARRQRRAVRAGDVRDAIDARHTALARERGDARAQLGIERERQRGADAPRCVRRVGRDHDRASAHGPCGRRDLDVRLDANDHRGRVLGVWRRRGDGRERRAERLREERADPRFIQARHHGRA